MSGMSHVSVKALKVRQVPNQGHQPRQNVQLDHSVRYVTRVRAGTSVGTPAGWSAGGTPTNPAAPFSELF